MKQITKVALGITIRFEYDGLGNRIAKHVTEGGDVTSTYYVLDAQGNVMHVYTGNTRAVDGGGTTYYLYLSERNLYGSSRLGQEQVNMALTQAAPFNYSGMLDNAYGDKRYELSNHLGNVLQVITDRKLPENDGTNHVAHYLADVVSYSDYFPYGMQMPGRNGNDGDGYRYGFQGQEKDDEVKGTGNSVNYKYRMHDPRIGRFFAVDPLASKYPYYSPYAFSGNRVLDAIELEGLEPAKYQDQYGGQDIFDYELRGDQFTTGVGVIKDGQFTDLGDFHYVFVEFEQQIESMNSGCSPMESGNDYGVPLVSDNKGSEIQAESTFGSIAGDLAGPMADGAEEFGKRGDKLRKTTTPLKSTGDIEYYNNAWGGNQHVKTERVFGKNLTKRLADGMPVVGTALDIMEVWDGIQKDGGFDSMGKNTAKEFVGAVGGAVGGTGGAWGGALTGAAIGSVIPGVGTVIGGFIGGVAGAFFGSWGGEAASETLIENVVK